MQAPEQQARRRLAVLATVVLALAFYLSRASVLAVEAKGRPTVLPERLIAAVLGPSERASYRAARGMRELLGAVFHPRALRNEAGELQVRAEDRMRVATAMREYLAEYSAGDSGVRAASETLRSRLEDATPATVIGADPTGRRRLAMLNVGAKNGLRHGMGVVVGADLVGQVERVNRATSVAYLSTDRAFAVSARCLRSGHYLGTVRGDGVDGMRVDAVPLSVDVREGDVLVVAPSLEGPPADIRVGVVTWVAYATPDAASPANASEAFEGAEKALGWRVVHLRSLADPSSLVDVLIVQPHTESAGFPEKTEG